MTYRSTDELTVRETDVPDGTPIESPAPGVIGTRTRACVLDIPDYDAAGRLVYRRKHIPVFDSAADYRPVDLTAAPADQSVAGSNRTEYPYWNGGSGGWYYGVWSGYYDWDAARIGTSPAQGHEGPPARRRRTSRARSTNFETWDRTVEPAGASRDRG
ncbi:MAG: hypothetical protein HC888_17540, partial [Candidatus Competibacteraceae bacterium]|nr:hypothetical protein [Candidatus Competibacteraceae bacterium]